MIKTFIIVQKSPFYPSFGLRVLSLPASGWVSVRPSVCHCPAQWVLWDRTEILSLHGSLLLFFVEFVRAITRRLFKLGSTNLVQMCKRPWLWPLLLCGAIYLDRHGQIQLTIKKSPQFWARSWQNSPPIEVKSQHCGRVTHYGDGSICVKTLYFSLWKNSLKFKILCFF